MNNDIKDITLIIGPPGPPDLVSLIKTVSEKEKISNEDAWGMYVKAILFEKDSNNERSSLLNELFSKLIGFDVQISKIFYTHLRRKGHKYPGVIIQLNQIKSAKPELVNSFFSDKSNRDIVGSTLGLGFKSQWVYVSVSK